MLVHTTRVGRWIYGIVAGPDGRRHPLRLRVEHVGEGGRVRLLIDEPDRAIEFLRGPTPELLAAFGGPPTPPR